MAASEIRTIELPLGDSIPVLGQGTLHLGEDTDRWDVELEALQLGLDLGLRLIETAEMYADGAAEELVGDAIYGRREEVFLVGGVRAAHATRREMMVACDQSLKRLGMDWSGDLAELDLAFPPAAPAPADLGEAPGRPG